MTKRIGDDEQYQKGFSEGTSSPSPYTKRRVNILVDGTFSRPSVHLQGLTPHKYDERWYTRSETDTYICFGVYESVRTLSPPANGLKIYTPW